MTKPQQVGEPITSQRQLLFTWFHPFCFMSYYFMFLSLLGVYFLPPLLYGWWSMVPIIFRALLLGFLGCVLFHYWKQRNVDKFQLLQRSPSVVIVGAGFSGICAAIKLKEAGITDITIYEKSDGEGGTWKHNIYPGSGCDAPSHLYQFSFELNPDWTRNFAKQPEILQYIKDVVAKYDLGRHIVFNTVVTGAEYNKELRQWSVKTCPSTFEQDKKQNKSAGSAAKAPPTTTTTSTTCNYFISCVGQLHIPKYPSSSIDGVSSTGFVKSFKGESFHSSEWRHDISLKGKRVAVIGCGASAIQFVSSVASDAKEMLIFQRSPNYILDKALVDFEYSPLWRFLFKFCPFFLSLYHLGYYWRFEAQWLFVRDRLDRMSAMFRSIISWRQTYAYDQYAMDEAKRKQLTPDYAPGAKRLLIAGDFFPTIMRSNVKLITDTVVAISATGIVCKKEGGETSSSNSKGGGAAKKGAGGGGGGEEEEHAVDVIIFATGFDVSNFLSPISPHLLNGQGKSLQEYWAGEPYALDGIMVPSFPNFFMCYGPNTNLVHNHILMMIECQVTFIVNAIRKAEMTGMSQQNKQGNNSSSKSRRSIEARLEVVEKRRAIDHKFLDKCAWADPSTTSWYKTKTGQQVVNCPSSTVYYWWRTCFCRDDELLIE